MPAVQLLEQPADIQIRIISELDGGSILACKKAVPSWGQLIENTLELQYKLELSLAGMVNGPPSSIPIHHRLNALRKYRAAWKAHEHPIHTIDIPSAPPIPPNAATLVWHSYASGSITVCQTPATFGRVNERVDVYAGWTELVGSRSPSNSPDYVVSAGQDLIMYIWPQTVYPAATFASLSNRFGRHPLALRHKLHSCFTLPFALRSVNTRYPLQILGEIASWSGRHSARAPQEMLVMNWQTGTLVWHMHGTPAQHIRLLTLECVAVVDNTDLSLRLYRFDPRAPVPCALATADGCECVLNLPALAPNVAYAEMDSVIGHPPDYPSHTRPLLVHDPSLSPLVLDVTMSVGMPPRSNHPAERYGRTLEERFLLFVPPETIRKLGSPDESERGRVIPWEDWGPAGTRMVRIPTTSSTPSALGTKVMVCRAKTEGDRSTQIVTVYEVSPLAGAIESDGRSAESGACDSETSPPDEEDAESWLKDAHGWRDPVETRYPFSTTWRLLAHVPVRSSVLLSHDGLVLAQYS